MPSKTLKQQHFFGMIHAFQMGKLHTKDLPKGVREKVKKAAKSISPKASGEFAARVEESSELNEISKPVLGSYINKAAESKANLRRDAAFFGKKAEEDKAKAAASGKTDYSKDSQAAWLKRIAKVNKRTKGIERAVGKLVQEEDDIDFAALSFVEFVQMEAALIEAFSELSDHEISDLIIRGNA